MWRTCSWLWNVFFTLNYSRSEWTPKRAILCSATTIRTLAGFCIYRASKWKCIEVPISPIINFSWIRKTSKKAYLGERFTNVSVLNSHPGISDGSAGGWGVYVTILMRWLTSAASALIPSPFPLAPPYPSHCVSGYGMALSASQRVLELRLLSSSLWQQRDAPT